VESLSEEAIKPRERAFPLPVGISDVESDGLMSTVLWVETAFSFSLGVSQIVELGADSS
jgi:hypothetical protein